MGEGGRGRLTMRMLTPRPGGLFKAVVLACWGGVSHQEDIDSSAGQPHQRILAWRRGGAPLREGGRELTCQPPGIEAHCVELAKGGYWPGELHHCRR